MADLFDYLEWRADVPFSVDPFNEVDNMILSELSYTCFEDMPLDESRVALREAYERFFAKHTREEIESENSYTAKSALLMETMCAGARFADTELFCYINEVDREKDVQLSAVTFVLSDGTAFVAYRGTDNTLVGWKEDFDISFIKETYGQRRAAEYLDMIGSKLDMPLRVGGHSKGGNFAVYASAFCDKSVQKRIINVYSNDGPGFREEIVASEGYEHILPKIISIVPDTSVIGMLMSSRCGHTVIKSSANGVYQHDGFTWQVRRNRFERAERSELGKYINDVLDEWSTNLDDEMRKTLTYSVFTLLEATGKEKMSEISEQKWRSAEAMLSSVSGLSKEQKRELVRIIGLLLKSGGQTAKAFLPSRKNKAAQQ